MKKLLFLLALGVSGVAIAAVVPTEQKQIHKPQVTGVDMSKRKIIRKERPRNDQTDASDVASLQRYRGVVTKDNIDALENASHLMQDNPEALMRRAGGGNMEFENSTGGANYVKTDAEASPEERLANIQAPSVTDIVAYRHLTMDEIKQKQQNALKQIELIGRKQLGQKKAPIMQVPTVEDIEESGIDVAQLPEGWQNMVAQTQETQKELNKLMNSQEKRQAKSQKNSTQKAK